MWARPSAQGRAGQGALLLSHTGAWALTPRLVGSRYRLVYRAGGINFYFFLKMTSFDPLKSALSISNVGDTSLALPCAGQSRSGQQRVLQQVQLLKRNRSRHSSGSNGFTSLSPSSPLDDNVFIDIAKSHKLNGSVFFRNGISNTITQEKAINQQTWGSSLGGSGARAYSSHSVHRGGSKGAGQLISSRSTSNVTWKRSVQNTSGVVQNQLPKGHRWLEKTPVQFTTMPSDSLNQSVYTQNGAGMAKQNQTSQINISKSLSKSMTKVDTSFNGSSAVADITMKDAVDYLSFEDEKYQYCGASYIQHTTFMDDKAKEEVFKLKGIPKLVRLLKSSSLQVTERTSAALRNLSFKHNANKEEIQQCGGITEAVALLRDTDSVNIQKQLTGLLWNLSSADSLKPDLLKSAMPALMECVILPCTTGPNRIFSSSQDPEVFYNATGCLRNLSSSQQNNRQAMRKCRGLIDSLVSYVKECVEGGKPDDKSTENCVCILHNLTFQLEAEAPALFSRMTALSKPVNRSSSQVDAGPIGCFNSHSKGSEYKHHFDFPVVEEPQPSGAGWLIHSKTLQSYLSLLGSSQLEDTQEACCGAMQNLIAHEGIVSNILSHTIVQKLNGLQVLTPLLKSSRVNVQRNTLALIGSLAKNPNLQTSIARKVLPELLNIVCQAGKDEDVSDDTLAMACQTAKILLMKEPEMGAPLLNHNLINSLNDLSKRRYLPKSSKAAALLLYSLWSDKEIQNILKKQGMSKSKFVNDITTAAHKSAQVID